MTESLVLQKWKKFQFIKHTFFWCCTSSMWSG